MVLLVAEDLAEVFAEGELVELVGLADAAAVVADGLLLVFEVEAEHVFGLFAGLDGLGGDGGVAAEEVDPVAELEGVVELLPGVDFELAGDVHVGGALEDLGVVDVGDDGLELALEVLVEEVDELGFGDGGGLWFWLGFCHGARGSLSGEWVDTGVMRAGVDGVASRATRTARGFGATRTARGFAWRGPCVGWGWVRGGIGEGHLGRWHPGEQRRSPGTPPLPQAGMRRAVGAGMWEEAYPQPAAKDDNFVGGSRRKKQIPKGNDRKKGNGKGKGGSCADGEGLRLGREKMWVGWG